MRQDSAEKQLSTIRAQIRDVIWLTEEEANILVILRQIHAVQAALNKVSWGLREDHFNKCMAAVLQDNDPHKRERALTELVDVLSGAIQA